MLCTTGRTVGTIFAGKARFKLLDSPKFEAFTRIISVKPSNVKCSLYLTKRKADLILVWGVIRGKPNVV